MTTKDKIRAAIDSLDEQYLDVLYILIQNFADSKQQLQKNSFMSKVKQIKIDAPEDFATNLDSYLGGEKLANKIFIDTLFVVALINRRDQYHQQASELAHKFESYPFLTTDAVLL